MFEVVRSVSGEHGVVGMRMSKCPVGWTNEGGRNMDEREDESFYERRPLECDK